jgi:hypothetical protein
VDILCKSGKTTDRVSGETKIEIVSVRRPLRLSSLARRHRETSIFLISMASDLTTRKQLPTEASQQQQEYTEEQYHEDQVAGQPVAMGKTASTQCADFLASTTTTANFVEASALDPSHVYVNSAGIGVVDQISAEDVLLDAAIAYDHKRAAPSATPGEHLLPYNNNNNKRLRTELFSSPVPETIPSPVAAQAKKVHNAQWDGMFERLRVYKLRYGDCLVPKRFADDSKLGTWVETQVSYQSINFKTLYIYIYMCVCVCVCVKSHSWTCLSACIHLN